jgi:hypothetical protein
VPLGGEPVSFGRRKIRSVIGIALAHKTVIAEPADRLQRRHRWEALSWR